jgi:uncharacterized delta-60 repeat protein
MAGWVDSGAGTTSNMDSAVARLLPDGSPDPGFGVGGKVLVPFDLVADGADVAYGITEDSVGRLVIAGGAADVSLTTHPTVARLKNDGTLDMSFGSSGKKVYEFGGTAEVFTGTAMQGTQIIGAGQTSDGVNEDHVVARIEVDLLFADGFE